MVQESSCGAKWIAAAQDAAAEVAQPIELDRECFTAQLANALTTINGLVYLTHQASSHADRKRYLGAMQDTVGRMTQSLQPYLFTPDTPITPGGRPSE